jgi:early secretory antigenic target protein ESAT-6
MSRYQVDSDEVLGASAAVRGSIGRIQAEVGALHGQLVNLQSSWTGQASVAFQSLAADWKATQQRVEENLAAINQALNVAGQQYAEIEASNARLFGR